MRRLTTPTHIFNVPFDTGIISKLRLIYAQGETIILTKTEADCECEGQTIRTILTQEETASFDSSENYAEIQIHILTKDNKSLVSKILKVSVEKCLDAEVLQ